MYDQVGSVLLVLVLVGLLEASSCRMVPAAPEGGNRADHQATTAGVAVVVPPDGKRLYEFLMREEPELMAEIPCACCDAPLALCYQGLCPYS